MKLYIKLTAKKREEINHRAARLNKKTVTRYVCNKTGKRRVMLSCKVLILYRHMKQL